jgi:hypothetical protein
MVNSCLHRQQSIDKVLTKWQHYAIIRGEARVVLPEHYAGFLAFLSAALLQSSASVNFLPST